MIISRKSFRWKVCLAYLCYFLISRWKMGKNRPPCINLLAYVNSLLGSWMFLFKGISLHTSLKSGFMDKYLYVSTIIYQILTWHGVSRVENVAMFGTFQQACICLWAVINLYSYDFINIKLSAQYFPYLTAFFSFRLELSNKAINFRLFFCFAFFNHLHVILCPAN